MSQSPPPSKPSREWMPRLWEGANLRAWLRVVAKNHWAIHPAYLYIAGIVTGVSTCHTALRIVQEEWYGSRVDKTPIREAPVFIVGHWRTGTTLLHELLILDERHNFPNTYQCLAPNHFLLTEKLFTRLFAFLLPKRRPMDNMAFGFDRPQEDEFALCLLGQPSPYLTIAFPNHPPMDQEAFNLDGLPPRVRAEWKRSFLYFLRQLTFRDPRRLILKSPTHSCRIPTLLELFPDARFVHIVRDPYTVFRSTYNLWKALYETHGMQKPTCAGLEEFVFSTFTNLYRRLEESKKLVRPGRFHELKYEDLLRDPVGEMQKVYDGLQLNEFQQVRPKIDDYFRSRADYQTNKYPSLSPEQREQITRRWGEVIRRYGYG